MNRQLLSPFFLAAFFLAFQPAPACAQVAAAGRSAPLQAAGPLSFAGLTPETLLQRYQGACAKLETGFQAILSVPASQRSFDNTVRAYDAAMADFHDEAYHLSYLAYVAPDESLRVAAQNIQTEMGKYSVSLGAHEGLYRAMGEYAAKKEALAGADQKLLDETLRGFELRGLGLPSAQRARLLEVKKRLVDLGTRFRANIVEASVAGGLDLKAEELKGLPEDYVAKLERSSDGTYRVGLKDSDHQAVMKYAEDGDVRRRMRLALQARAAEKNVPLLAEALKLRQESARILGHESYAHAEISELMAGTPSRAWNFLDGLRKVFLPRAEKERETLLSVKRESEPSAERLESWDFGYFAEKLRRTRYNLDANEVKQYFTVDGVIDGTMRVYSRLLGVRFTRVPSDDVWHPDVRLYRIEDAGGREIGHFYLDIFSRDGKKNGASAANLVQGRELPDGSYKKTVSAVMANFQAPAPGRPALLEFDNVRTFFHEFGHLMHQTLTRARYASFSGTNVARDFVETPSKMSENFILEREVLDEISGHYQDSSRKLPDELLEKMTAAVELTEGLNTLGQVALSMIDQIYHTVVPEDTTRIFNEYMRAVALVEPQPGTAPEASFAHIVSGYEAVYYGYQWSKALAGEIYSRFKEFRGREGGVINPAAGGDYRREILEHGGDRPEMESMTAFLGREPSVDAYAKKVDGEASAEEPSQVTGEFLNAARSQGLADPLTGLDDARLKNPDVLVEQNWVKHEMPDLGVVLYRYQVGEKVSQIYGVRDDGMVSILSFIYKGGKRHRVEKIVRWPDGTVVRDYEESKGSSPAA